jgi:DNA-binding transcriptional regulator/RsmH inhibitor MraZ
LPTWITLQPIEPQKFKQICPKSKFQQQKQVLNLPPLLVWVNMELAEQVKIKMDSKGRICIPAEIRKENRRHCSHKKSA